MRSTLIRSAMMVALLLGCANQAAAAWWYCAAWDLDRNTALYSGVWESREAYGQREAEQREAERAFRQHVQGMGYFVESDRDVECERFESRREAARNRRAYRSDYRADDWTVRTIEWVMSSRQPSGIRGRSGQPSGIRGRSGGENGCYFGECPDGTASPGGGGGTTPVPQPPNPPQPNPPQQRGRAEACQIYQPVMFWCMLHPNSGVRTGEACWCPSAYGPLSGVAIGR